jgi:hypothetical protein
LSSKPPDDSGAHPTSFFVGANATDDSPLPSYVEIKNGWNYTPCPPICLYDLQWNNFTLTGSAVGVEIYASEAQCKPLVSLSGGSKF